jgi:protein TonB
MSQSLASFTWETTHMSINLIESKRRSRKSVRSTMVSVALHAAMITLAVYATASAGEVVATHVEVDTPIYTAPSTTKADRPHTNSHPVAPKIPTYPREGITFRNSIICDSLPPDIPTTTVAATDSLFARGNDGGGASDSVSGLGHDTGAPYSASQVEKPALPREGNPNPRYPSLLESSRVEGTVLAQFVVDTLGHADMSTFKILDSSNDLFSESLRSALAQWRFYPAEAGGRRVKQIVQLPLKFIAPFR